MTEHDIKVTDVTNWNTTQQPLPRWRLECVCGMTWPLATHKDEVEEWSRAHLELHEPAPVDRLAAMAGRLDEIADRGACATSCVHRGCDIVWLARAVRELRQVG